MANPLERQARKVLGKLGINTRSVDPIEIKSPTSKPAIGSQEVKIPDGLPHKKIPNPFSVNEIPFALSGAEVTVNPVITNHTGYDKARQLTGTGDGTETLIVSVFNKESTVGEERRI